MKNSRRPACFLVGLALLSPTAFPAEEVLRITAYGPSGELQRREQAAEIRVVFSEPMVPLGRVPEPVTAPFFRIEPAVEGAFRWSGTDTLVFTPRAPLPEATRYQVTIERTARAVSGRALPRRHAFSFVTPGLRIVRATWYRQGGRSDAPLRIGLRFNQPVGAGAVLPRLSLAGVPQELVTPPLPRVPEADPRAVADYEARLERVRAAAASREPIAFEAAAEWDEERMPPGDELVVLATKASPPPGSWLGVRLGAQLVTLKLEPALLVTGFRCSTACDPDDYNPLRFPLHVGAAALRGRVRVTDVTDPGTPVPLEPEGESPEGDEWAPDYGDGEDYDRSTGFALEDVGFRLLPARSYLVSVDRGLRSADGQLLGYTWRGIVENWHRRPFASFGAGHGVWEAGGGALLPYQARNLQTVTEWLAPLAPDALVPTLRSLQGKGFALAPPAPARSRTLQPVPDRIQAFGLDLGPLLTPRKTGLFWAALKPESAIPRAPLVPTDEKGVRATLVQVTNLGITVKDSPQNTLVFVTRLDDGAPVPGARITIRNMSNAVVFSGPTDPSGLVVASGTGLRSAERPWELSFVVSAEKDGDVAYLASDWNDAVEPWYWGIDYDLDEAKPVLRGSVFPDRGVYRLGEEVRLKAILRSDTARGMQLLPAGARLKFVLRDSQGRDVEAREVALSEWGSADWRLRLPEDAPLGRWALSVTAEGQRRAVDGDLLVAAYRRPEFRVDASLAAETTIAGAGLKGVVAGRYLFGAPMAKRPVRWSLSRTPLFDVPKLVREAFPEERFVFLGAEEEPAPRGGEEQQSREAELDAEGRIALDLPTERSAGRPYAYTLEGEVTDISRQALAGRASFRVDPAPWYVGLRRPSFFAQAGQALDTEVVAVDLAGRPTAGVRVKVTLTQVQWNSVRRAEGAGYYTWETEKREVPAGEWSVSTLAGTLPLRVPVPSGGFFQLKAVAEDGEGRTSVAAASFYAVGAGYTAWERYDHPRIDLVPEKKTYKPGESARILVKSPWEKATALLTTEREGIRVYRTFTLGSTQETVTIPITERDVPNVHVSVLLVKGRTAAFVGDDTSDPGRPAFRVGYAELRVDDGSKRLQVKLGTDREEYRPGAKAHVEVTVSDPRAQAGPAEVTLWAVDHGVLSLTGYRTPDVRGSVWVEKALQVMTEDSRQNIISRRVLSSKGAAEGGGGGLDEGPGSVRRDFRPLAFWLGSLVTDAQGRAVADVTLPESLTTWRVMAVAGDKLSRFGAAEREIRTSKPVLVQAAFPRFLALGDRASLGTVVHSRLKEKGSAIVTARSLDPAVLELTGEPRQALEVPAGGSAPASFEARARATGTARLQVTVHLLGESDALEETLPVRVLAPLETMTAYGEAVPSAREAIELPKGVVPGLGGLQVEAASSALLGLGEGARYLIAYPYGCAEQRASAAMALALAADLGGAFGIEGLDAAGLRARAQEAFRELESFQCEAGGFGFWKGGCGSVSPYLSAYVLDVLGRARALGYKVRPEVLERGYASLEAALSLPPPADVSLMPVSLAAQAFAARVLAQAGRNADSALTRLVGESERLPHFAAAYLLEALRAKGDGDARAERLELRLRSSILMEGGTAHVEELQDPWLVWLWSSNVRSTAVALRALAGARPDDPLLPRLARWLVQARQGGRWGNTQENALALDALARYYRAREGDAPDFVATIRLGLETLARHEMRGRSTEARVTQLPLAALAAKGRPGERLELVFEREGRGTLHYSARLRYAAAEAPAAALDNGLAVERSYAPARGSDVAAPGTRFRAGELVRVTLRLRLTKERRFVALRDPLPAGLEPVESWFATTASDLARRQEGGEGGDDWLSAWRRGGFDRVERHDDRVQLFATRLAAGEHVFSYLARATTPGVFGVAAARAEEMYAPEAFGRSAGVVVEIVP